MGDEVKVLLPVYDHLKLARDIQSYRLANRSTHYGEQVAKLLAKWPTTFQVQRKSQMFDTMDPLSNVGFRKALKFACEENKVHEKAAM